MKTNAIRILEQLKITYTIQEYEFDAEHLGAEHVAQQVGFPPDQVFKTLVVKGDRRGIMVACLPGNAELDLKNLAVASGNKKVEMIPVKEIQTLTGYIRGGVSPIGMKKKYPTFLDESALHWDVICISAGARGVQIIMNPQELMKTVDAELIAITR